MPYQFTKRSLIHILFSLKQRVSSSTKEQYTNWLAVDIEGRELGTFNSRIEAEEFASRHSKRRRIPTVVFEEVPATFDGLSLIRQGGLTAFDEVGQEIGGAFEIGGVIWRTLIEWIGERRPKPITTF